MLDETFAWFFNTGTSYDAYNTLGCHLNDDGSYSFAVWAKNASAVSVVGDFNNWDRSKTPMKMLGSTGIWYCNSNQVHEGDCYKFAIVNQDSSVHLKTDPFAFYTQKRPETAAIAVGRCGYNWNDKPWLDQRAAKGYINAPVSIYEVHIGSWRKGLLYRDLIDTLIPYVKDMGYTHIELMPIMEHPLDDSWGYQVIGFFSPTSRYGTGYELKQFIDACHKNGIGVILDFVAAHFPKDEHGLRLFDGTPLFEHHDTRRSEQRQWGTLMFDYSKPQVQSFMLSCAMYWLSEYHFDGLRVDAVSFMLYHDYCKDPMDALKNEYGGSENLEAIEFFHKLSNIIRKNQPGAMLIAEESTAFPHVTDATSDESVGFDLKWNMGYMHDTLKYMQLPKSERARNHNLLSFPMCYAYTERFVLPFSHDEVVHGKYSLIGRIPGSYDEKFSQLRLLYLYQYASVGKKLQFMGAEFAQIKEWDFKTSLDWNLLSFPRHVEVQRFMRMLNSIYKTYDALYTFEDGWHGFTWIIVDDARNQTISFMRFGESGSPLLCVLNFSEHKLSDYILALPSAYNGRRLLSTNEWQYGGAGDCAPDFFTTNSTNNITHITLAPFEGCLYALTNKVTDNTNAEVN